MQWIDCIVVYLTDVLLVDAPLFEGGVMYERSYEHEIILNT